MARAAQGAGKWTQGQGGVAACAVGEGEGASAHGRSAGQVHHRAAGAALVLHRTHGVARRSAIGGAGIVQANEQLVSRHDGVAARLIDQVVVVARQCRSRSTEHPGVGASRALAGVAACNGGRAAEHTGCLPCHKALVPDPSEPAGIGFTNEPGIVFGGDRQVGFVHRGRGGRVAEGVIAGFTRAQGHRTGRDGETARVGHTAGHQAVAAGGLGDRPDRVVAHQAVDGVGHGVGQVAVSAQAVVSGGLGVVGDGDRFGIHIDVHRIARSEKVSGHIRRRGGYLEGIASYVRHGTVSGYNLRGGRDTCRRNGRTTARTGGIAIVQRCDGRAVGETLVRHIQGVERCG